MPHQSMRVAGVEVTPLCDAIGPMGPSIRRPLAEIFPNATAADWAGLDTDEWILHFHCYLLREDSGRTVLVDTGIGGTDSPAASWAPVPGVLGEELAAVGVAPGEIDVVVLTHLHADHASGATIGGAPAFPAARYVVQQADVDWATGPVVDQVLRPLAEQLEVVDGDAEVLPGIRVVHTPGHTPGHQVVRVGDLVLTGDVLLHPVQLANPAVTYLYDDDVERATATRMALLDAVRARGGSIGTAHFAEPFTAV
jgi:glyoxylase-like metal-dependent hydrolase (beta-lactamase superfamily II)